MGTEIKVTKRDVAWGYVAQFFNIGVNVLLLPVVLRMLPAAELGVWYVFLAIWGFALMLDFGFQPTFGRNVAYAMSGARRLKAKGVEEVTDALEGPNYGLLKGLISTMRRFYAYVAGGALVLMLTAGTWHVARMTKGVIGEERILWAWGLFAVYTAVSLFYTYYNPLLIGRGLMREYNQMTIVTRVVYLAVAAAGLLAGYGIVSLVVGNLVSLVVNRVMARRFFYGGGIREALGKARYEGERLLPIVWHNAKRTGLGSVGAYFVQKGNVLFVSMFLSLEEVASFGLTTQIVTILAGVTPLYLQTNLPEIYKFRIGGRLGEIRRVFGESVFVYVTLYAIGAVVVLLWGNMILELLHSRTLLLPAGPLLLYLAIQFLESNHSMAASLITTRNEVPYVWASVVSGACIATLTLLSLSFTSLGVTGVILSAGVVQLCYNNWKWPLVVCRELGAGYMTLFREGGRSLWAFARRHLKG